MHTHMCVYVWPPLRDVCERGSQPTNWEGADSIHSMFATHAHSPCSAASASERTDCLPAQSFRNSSGISLSRLLSRTPGQTCVHVVSSLRADVDTCSSQQTQRTGLPCSLRRWVVWSGDPHTGHHSSADKDTGEVVQVRAV